ncbi:histidine kinase/DNA gyrase B/HSP90-like ATPase [Mucilaginibacter oryzae]|uniref:histidine kinase n=1 Tax=Mucilaginibacter oryzae TaxID=468058 RepID=A0A316GW84_9SPHI|nr:HAMP domain-containing sensor histidine kinase [Mucilaginibacter oryzae]PWK68308.1 histidine kinase/DNA gyrase B/HSP90-like ATPase [Mucilaginibacter oryzae]
MKRQIKTKTITKPSLPTNSSLKRPKSSTEAVVESGVTNESVQALLSSISHDIRERIRSIKGRLSLILDDKLLKEKAAIELTRKLEVRIKDVGDTISAFRTRQQMVGFQTIIDFIQSELHPKLAAYTETLNELNASSRNTKAEKELDAVQTHSKRMIRIVDGINNYAKSSGKLNRTPFGVHNEVEKVKNDLEKTIEENSAEVIHTGSAKISGDQLKIAQLLQNLIQNSITYAKDDVPPRIEIELKNIRTAELSDEMKKHLINPQANGYVYIKVTDNGIGIAEEHQKKVFDLHYRINPDRKSDDLKRIEDNRRKEEGRGGGLGLAIVKSVAEAHEGAVWLESKVGSGTIIHVLLITNK